MKRAVSSILTMLGLIGLDQVTKYLAVTHLKGHAPFVIWNGVFELYYSENTGAAFGIMKNATWFFMIITIVILWILGYFYATIPEGKKYNILRTLLVFISAGAIGNFVDRFCNGYVVDFLYIRLINFPIFNVADMYVSLCGILLAVLLIFKYKDEDFLNV